MRHPSLRETPLEGFIQGAGTPEGRRFRPVEILNSPQKLLLGQTMSIVGYGSTEREGRAAERSQKLTTDEYF